jgi:two-component system, NtrC family, sensor kinase
MSLKKKLALSFLISVFIIAVLVVFEYANFVKIKNEIRHLEVTDTIRSKSVELRRHEKNFFLYPLKARAESEAVHGYLGELNEIINRSVLGDSPGKLHDLKVCIGEYRNRFNTIESSAKDLSSEFGTVETSFSRSNKLFPLIQSTLIGNPPQGIEFLKKVLFLPPDHRLIAGLTELEVQINALRKNGEDIIIISEELDRIARSNVDNTIRLSQLAMLIFFPLFFITGIGTIFFFNRDVVNRLKILTEVVEKTGKGNFKQLVKPIKSKDEVGTLIQTFNEMEEQLAQREGELERKNRELLQSQKLAAIGTLASGVAHELNNPLNNIYISSQVLEREIDDTSPPNLREVVKDIRGQTLRVKGIVGDLLEFARGRDPEFKEIELNKLIAAAYNLLGKSINLEKISFVLDSDPQGVLICADPEQMERVFINLFNNAVDAMSGEGDLVVKVDRGEELVQIKVSDSGKGMPVETAEKIFEPFFTTKDKGTGLGLAIVFNIIKKHDGKMSIESEKGKGTIFTITLPNERGCDAF